MKLKDFLAQATRQLNQAGIATARLDVLVLLEDVLNTNRTQLLAEPNYEITEVDLNTLHKLIARRCQHYPLAYLRGKTQFYGREFIINHHVLEPRPESETMIDLLKSLPVVPEQIADIGTGSGALAITAKLEQPDAKVVATDIDENCLKVTQKNSEKYGTEIKLLNGDLLEPLYDLKAKKLVLLCNLPYVPNNFQINPAAMNEPRLAIFGGLDGLDLYRKLFKQTKHLESKPIYIFTEALPPQHHDLSVIASHYGYRLNMVDDFIQLFELED